MMDYVTTSTGKPDTYQSPTGAVRDSQSGKPRYDLVHPLFMKRLAGLLARGAAKYSERNWEKGQETGRTLASLLRHVYAYIEAAELGDGGDGEDHLAAIAFNAMSLMVAEEGILKGSLPLTLQTVPARIEHFKWEVSDAELPAQQTVADAFERLGEGLANTYASIWQSFFNPVREITTEQIEEANRRATEAAEIDELNTPVCCISPSDCTCHDEPEAEIKDSSWYLAPRDTSLRFWHKLGDAFPYTQRDLMRVSVAPYNHYFRQDWKHYIYVPIKVVLTDDGMVQSGYTCNCDECSFVDDYLQDHRKVVDNFTYAPSVVVSYPFAVSEDEATFKTGVFTESDWEVWELFKLQNRTLAPQYS